MHKRSPSETLHAPSKLTLKLDAWAIHQAKLYAKKQHSSLSKLVETYFRMIGGSTADRSQFTPLVKELSGIIPAASATHVKKEYHDYLDQKYR